jgi:hypothetical protein
MVRHGNRCFTKEQEDFLKWLNAKDSRGRSQ